MVTGLFLKSTKTIVTCNSTFIWQLLFVYWIQLQHKKKLSTNLSTKVQQTQIESVCTNKKNDYLCKKKI